MATTRAKHGGDRSFFLNIPFDLVYSDGPILQEQDKAEITFRRNAEALVANCLPIGDSLKAILCRSVAERQTLLSLLPSEFYRWSTLIRVPDQHFYYRQWTYVEKISVMDDILTFWFNPSSRTPGPFKGYFVYEEFESGVKREWNGTIPDTRSRWSIRLAGAEMGNAELWLDGCLAFSGSVTFIELPF